MPLKTTILTLRIQYEADEYNHPRHWNWEDISDMGFDESIEVVKWKDEDEQPRSNA